MSLESVIAILVDQGHFTQGMFVNPHGDSWATLVDFGMSVWVISAQVRQMRPLFRVTKGLQL